MYRTDVNNRDRGGAIALVLAIHAGLLLAFLHLSGKIDLTDPQGALKVFDVTQPPPPPPAALAKPKPKDKEGGSASPNVKSEATAVVAPKPIVEPQKPNPIVAAETPRLANQATQGASIPGPGTGAGGIGNGTGSGSGGNGPGGGGGVAVPVTLVRGITARDYPPAIMRGWPRGGAIFLRLRIEPDGRPSRCDVMRSFGNASTDQWTCSLITQRGRFRPALDARGVPIPAWFGYKQADVGRQ